MTLAGQLVQARHLRKRGERSICGACASLVPSVPDFSLSAMLALSFSLGAALLGPLGHQSIWLTFALFAVVFATYAYRPRACAVCGQRRLVPLASPIGEELMRDYHPELNGA